MKQLKNGIEARKVENGIESMEKEHSRKSLIKHWCVNFVKKHTNQYGDNLSSARTNANQHNGESLKSTKKLENVSSVKQSLMQTNGQLQKHVLKNVQQNVKCTQKVYDIEVECDHCYYANGFLVSNSDAFRYAAIGIRAIGVLDDHSNDSDYKAMQAYFGG
jgi:intein/homing endonuclease